MYSDAVYLKLWLHYLDLAGLALCQVKSSLGDGRAGMP